MSVDAAATNDVEAAGSPLSWRALRDLFFAPRRFFSRRLQLADRPEVTFVAWICGVAVALERVDGVSKGALARSWVGTWIFVLLGGILMGALRWAVGGWWYRVRVEWCGEDDPDPLLARCVTVYQDFVLAAPAVLLAAVWTCLYSNLAEAASEGAMSMLLIVLFLFWSCITSYFAATTCWPKISRARAALWFLALPLLFYTLLAIVAA